MSEAALFNKIVYGLGRCPQCAVANPLIDLLYEPAKHFKDTWENTYYHFTGVCSKCKRHVLFYASGGDDPKQKMTVVRSYPSHEQIAKELPDMARKFLQQAVDSKHASDGALMLAASSIDAMLKSIGFSKGSLYSRIDEAKEQGAITSPMSEWAHSIRLSANDPRHADENFTGATEKQAAQSIEFAKALGEYLFVLPSKVAAGRESASGLD